MTARSVLYHHLGSPLKVRYRRKDCFIHNYSVLRAYYYCRNHTYLETRFAEASYKPQAFFYRGKDMLKDILLTLLYREQKIMRIYACILGTWHGLWGKLGKRDQFP